jgi:FixJ family two-component response regulator
MNGLELLEALRQEGFEKPFIVITSNGDRSVVVKALRLGAFDFLERPFEYSDVPGVLAEAMKVSKALQRLAPRPSF